MFPRRHGRVVSLLAFCVLAWAATASAECAWVLWISPLSHVRWDAAQGFRDFAGCEKRAIDIQKQWNETPERRGEVRCLPDTVDPREPKTK
jgi:hypothetical protein